MPPRRRKPPRAGALSDLPPIKIIRSIFLLQLAYYATASILILFTTLVLGQKFTPALILNWRSIRGDNTTGWTIGFTWLLTGFITVIPLLLLVARSKLVLDFSLTIHFVHLIVTSFFTKSFPTNLLWWALQGASAALMTSLGVWACRYRELRPISFGGNASIANKTTSNLANGAIETDEHIRGGRVRGRNMDAGPSYEMIGMKGSDNVV